MPDLSVWLETLHRLQPVHIAIMVQCSLVWRKIQSLRIAKSLANLVKWACFTLAAYAKNGTQIKLFMIWQGCFSVWQTSPNCADCVRI